MSFPSEADSSFVLSMNRSKFERADLELDLFAPISHRPLHLGEAMCSSEPSRVATQQQTPDGSVPAEPDKFSMVVFQRGAIAAFGSRRFSLYYCTRNSHSHKGKWRKGLIERQAMEAIKRKTAEDPKKLPSFLFESFHDLGSRPTPSAYRYVVKNLARKGCFSEVRSLLHQLENNETFNVPECIFVNLIRIYGDANMVQEALGVFLGIPCFRCKPSASSLNALLEVLCRKKGGVLLVQDVLLKSGELGIRLDDSSFRILLRALCKLGKVEHAIELLHMMPEHGCVPDSSIYSFVLRGLCMHRGSEEFMGFFDEGQKLGFCFDMMAYREMIAALLREGKAEDALCLLNKMKAEGVKPDIVTYTSIMDGFFKLGSFHQGVQVFDEILIMGLVPDVFTYSIYINGLCKESRVTEAFKILRTMEESGCDPNVITYNTIIVALCKEGKAEKANTLLREMLGKGLPGNMITYRVLIDAFIRKEELEEACNILSEMIGRGFLPHPESFDALFVKLFDRILLRESLQLLAMMFRRSISPGARIWETLLTSLWRSNCLQTTTILNDLIW